MSFEQNKPLFQVLIAFLLIGYGFWIILFSSFAQPKGGWLDTGLLVNSAIGCFYAFSGIWILVERPDFSKVTIALFIAFMLEISRIGTW